MEKLVQQIIAYISTIPRPKDWVLKLLSLFFALFLWYFVVGEDKVDMTVSIPVEIVNLPRDLVISNQFKKELEVTVSGQRSLIRGLANQHITRSIDLSNAGPGPRVIHNEPDSIDFPWGLSVLRVQPGNFTLLIDRLTHKNLTIQPVIKGSPPKNFKLLSVTLDPPKISISGPENVLASEKSLKTKPIDISDLTGFTSKQIPLDLKPELTELLGEPVVTAKIVIEEKKVEKLISDIPIGIKGANGLRYRLHPSKVNLRVRIPTSMLKEFKDLKKIFLAEVDPRDLASGNHALKVDIEIADRAVPYKDRLKILTLSPETVTLEISNTSKFKVKK